MPPFPKEPHLFAYKRDGRTAYVVRACSQAEARAHVDEVECTELVRLTPTAAFVAAEHGIQLLNAKPEYAHADMEAEKDLFVEPELDSNPNPSPIEATDVTGP